MQALSKFCCQNKKCPDFGKRGANNLTVCGWYGKNSHIRLLYCRTCKKRVSEQKSTPLFGLRLPEGKMVGHEDLYDKTVEQSRKVPNLDFKGFLPFTEVEKQFKKAKLFINTSEYEGFPNTFLQAWRRGIPVFL